MRLEEFVALLQQTRSELCDSDADCYKAFIGYCDDGVRAFETCNGDGAGVRAGSHGSCVDDDKCVVTEVDGGEHSATDTLGDGNPLGNCVDGSEGDGSSGIGSGGYGFQRGRIPVGGFGVRVGGSFGGRSDESLHGRFGFSKVAAGPVVAALTKGRSHLDTNWRSRRASSTGSSSDYLDDVSGDARKMLAESRARLYIARNNQAAKVLEDDGDGIACIERLTAMRAAGLVDHFPKLVAWVRASGFDVVGSNGGLVGFEAKEQRKEHGKVEKKKEKRKKTGSVEQDAHSRRSNVDGSGVCVGGQRGSIKSDVADSEGEEFPVARVIREDEYVDCEVVCDPTFPVGLGNENRTAEAAELARRDVRVFVTGSSGVREELLGGTQEELERQRAAYSKEVCEYRKQVREGVRANDEAYFDSIVQKYGLLYRMELQVKERGRRLREAREKERRESARMIRGG